jgi:hypothetical protein
VRLFGDHRRLDWRKFSVSAGIKRLREGGK